MRKEKNWPQGALVTGLATKNTTKYLYKNISQFKEQINLSIVFALIPFTTKSLLIKTFDSFIFENVNQSVEAGTKEHRYVYDGKEGIQIVELFTKFLIVQQKHYK